MFKKTMLLAAAAAMIVCAVCSCGGAKPGPSESSGTEASTGAEPVTSDAVDTQAPFDELYRDLPAGSYGGAEFTILQYEDQGAQFTALMDVEEDDGTLINSDLYYRTLNVEDKLKVDITLRSFLTTGEVTDAIREDVSSGDGVLDCFSTHSGFIPTHILNDEVLNLRNYEDFDFSKPWWNESVNKTLTFGDKLYAAYGYVNISLLDGQMVLAFNKEMAATYGLGDVYSMIDNKEWTLEKFLETSRGFEQVDDVFAIATYPYLGAPALIYGMNVSLFSKNSEGFYEYDGLTDKFYEVRTKLFDVLQNDQITNIDWQTYVQSFREGRALFVVNSLGALRVYRSDRIDFGIIPFPMYSEEQGEYLSYTTNQVQGVCIPSSCKDPGRAVIVLENMCAETYRLIKDDYYETLVNEKLLRDDESKRMVKMILSSKFLMPIENMFDLGTVTICDLFETRDAATVIAEHEDEIRTKLAEVTAIFRR